TAGLRIGADQLLAKTQRVHPCHRAERGRSFFLVVGRHSRYPEHSTCTAQYLPYSIAAIAVGSTCSSPHEFGACEKQGGPFWRRQSSCGKACRRRDWPYQPLDGSNVDGAGIASHQARLCALRKSLEATNAIVL